MFTRPGGHTDGTLTCVHFILGRHILRPANNPLMYECLGVCVCVCLLCVSVCVRVGDGQTLTGESKEKAHSLLNTLSPVLGTLMVGMYGTSSSPRSVAIFAFLLLAPQCGTATRAALSEERMLFLKHSVSTFLQPAGCDAEKHKNKMTEGWGTRCYTRAARLTLWRLMIFCFSSISSSSCQKRIALPCADITFTVDFDDAFCTRLFYQKGPSHL